MDIHGLQKMTLLDFPGKVACTVFLGGCDFRCPFCHNSDLLKRSEAPVLMDDQELLAFLKTRTALLEGVCFTGGEPLLRQDLLPVIEQVRALGFAVKLDTNGTHPERLKELLDRGLLDYVAMDIKNAPDRYAATVGFPLPEAFGPIMDRIRESIRLIMGSGIPYEFRTTVVREFHDEASFPAIGAFIRGASRYYLQCFTDRDKVLCEGLTAPTAEELERFRALAAPFVGKAELRGVD